jgi:hypothetical protein
MTGNKGAIARRVVTHVDFKKICGLTRIEDQTAGFSAKGSRPPRSEALLARRSAVRQRVAESLCSISANAAKESPQSQRAGKI